MLSTALLSLLLLADQTAPQDVPEADLGEIVVVGGRPTWLVSVVVTGDADATTLVTSEPDVRCGPDRYRWEDFGRPRLCWTRREWTATTVLAPRSTGTRDRDWTVDWTGCTRVRPTGECEITPTANTTVTARFRKPG